MGRMDKGGQIREGLMVGKRGRLRVGKRGMGNVGKRGKVKSGN